MKLFSCLTQLEIYHAHKCKNANNCWHFNSWNFNIYISMINTMCETLKARNVIISILDFDEQFNFHAQLSMK